MTKTIYIFPEQKQPVSFHDYLHGIFAPGSAFNGTWISDHEFMYRDGHRNSLNIFDVKNPSNSKCIMSCHYDGIHIQ